MPEIMFDMPALLEAVGRCCGSVFDRVWERVFVDCWVAHSLLCVAPESLLVGGHRGWSASWVGGSFDYHLLVSLADAARLSLHGLIP